MPDITTKDDIITLVDTFYGEAIKDKLIGKFFTEVVPLNFEAHMPTMYAFWEGILLNGNEYRGNPMVKHMALHQKELIKPSHFKQWLYLWHNTIDKLFEGPKANEAKQKAQQIAGLMEMKIGLMG